MKPERGGLSEADIALMESALRISRAEDKTLISAPLELEQPFGQELEWQNAQNAPRVQAGQTEEKKQE